MNNDFTILHLSLITDIGPGFINKLVEQQSEQFQLADLYQMSAADIQRFGIAQERAQKIVSGLSDIGILDKECALIEKHGINWTTRYSDEYPELLKAIHMPPAVLYWRGTSFAEHQQCVAIIGSRKANGYGESFINRVVPDLVSRDWTIVSGGALGADAMAHRAALKSGGKTIVVLGSGLLKPAPLTNKRLFDEVVANGGIVMSAFVLERDAGRETFPERNRIISGLSRGCLVVQAAAKSGTKITAEYALDQGRDVFAVPGLVDDELSRGCHQLIQQGAKLVYCAEDILEEYQDVAVYAPKPQVRAIDRVRKTRQMSIIADLPPADTPEGVIVRACATPCSMDELASKTGMSLPQIQAKLFAMQLNGAIRQDFSGLWTAAK